MFKKATATILCLLMCVSLLSGVSFAADDVSDLYSCTVKPLDTGYDDFNGLDVINDCLTLYLPSAGEDENGFYILPEAIVFDRNGKKIFGPKPYEIVTPYGVEYSASEGFILENNQNFEYTYYNMDGTVALEAMKYFFADVFTSKNNDDVEYTGELDAYYIYASDFYNGKAVVTACATQQYHQIGVSGWESYCKTMIIDTKGNVVYTFPEDFKISDYNSGMIFSGGAFYDFTGKKVISEETCSKYGEIYGFEGAIGLVSSAETGLFGLIDRTGKEILPCEYNLCSYNEKYNAFIENGKYGFIDVTGKVIVPAIYDGINDTSGDEALFPVKKGEKYGVVDINGNVVLPFEYDYISEYYHGVCYVAQDRKISIVTFAPKTVKNTAKVVLSAQKLTVNGANVNCEKYNIDGSNYFKLRDLAAILNGTGSQFAVGWDEVTKTVSITSGSAYSPVGGELEAGTDKSSTAVESTQTIIIDGKAISGLGAFNIGGNNFFKLRDLAEYLGYEVDYDAQSNSAVVNSAAAD